MHDIELKRSNPSTICISNCDKDGALVSARIAGLMNGVSVPRSANLQVDSYTDRDSFTKVADKFVRLYEPYKDCPLLKNDTIVLSSVHRTSLYIAEVLHAYLLPLQVISFSQTIEQAKSSGMLAIGGTDYDLDAIWQWNKITRPSDFPDSYLSIIKKCNKMVIVRSSDTSEDSPILGRAGDIFFNSSLKRLRPERWMEMTGCLDKQIRSFPELGQWEWGLPDETVKAAKSLWTQLGKKESDLHLIEDSTVNLYKLTPLLWGKYLGDKNRLDILGLSLNSYWTAHPHYERCAGIIPIPFYNFRAIRDDIEIIMKRYCSPEARFRYYAFINNSGRANDIEEVKRLISTIGFPEKWWFSIGYDLNEAYCRDVFGGKIAPPYRKVMEWIQDSPYRNHNWQPLEVDDLYSCISEVKSG